MGVAFLPALYVRSDIRSDDPDVRVVPLERPRPLRSVGLLARKTSESGEAFSIIASLIQSVARSAFGCVLIREESVDTASHRGRDPDETRP